MYTTAVPLILPWSTSKSSKSSRVPFRHDWNPLLNLRVIVPVLCAGLTGGCCCTSGRSFMTDNMVYSPTSGLKMKTLTRTPILFGHSGEILHENNDSKTRNCDARLTKWERDRPTAPTRIDCRMNTATVLHWHCLTAGCADVEALSRARRNARAADDDTKRDG